jgi:hypothetical protein
VALLTFAGLYVGGQVLHQELYGPGRPDLNWGVSVYWVSWLLVGLSLLASAGRQLSRWPALPLGVSVAACYLLGVGLLTGAWSGYLPHPWRLLHLTGCGLVALELPLLMERLTLRSQSKQPF